MKCSKCKVKLSGRELDVVLEAQEFGPVIPICDDCYNLDEYRHIEPEQYSDADPGL